MKRKKRVCGKGEGGIAPQKNQANTKFFFLWNVSCMAHSNCLGGGSIHRATPLDLTGRGEEEAL